MAHTIPISIYLTNARGILSKPQLADLSGLLCSHHNIIAITETHLDKSIPDGIITQNNQWTIFRRDRNRFGGGVAILSKLASKIRTDLQSTHGEDLWIESTLNGQRTVIGVVYRPPSSSSEKIDYFTNNLEISIKKAASSSQILCLLGDFNAKSSNWLSGSITDTAGFALSNLLDSYNLTQIVSEVTRPPGGQGLPSTNGQGSLLDLIITNRPALFESPSILCPLGSSDHFSVQAFMKLSHKTLKKSSRRLWNIKKANIHAFLSDLDNQYWPSKNSTLPIDTQWLQWFTTFSTVATRNIPSKIVKAVSSKPPWLSDSVLAESKFKKHLFKLYKNNPSEENLKQFRAQRNKVTALLRRAKKSFSSCLENQLHHTSMSGNFWSFIRQLRANSKSNVFPTTLIKPDGSRATTNKDKADTLNDHFLSQSTTLNCSDPIFKICPPPLPSLPQLSQISVSSNEVLSVLKNLNHKKSPGLDQLSNNILSAAAPVICHSLAVLFNNSLSCGKIPTPWKTSKIRAIFKRGRKDLPDNYRPISLLSNVSKVLEGIVNKNINRHLSSHDLLAKNQSGFRHGDSAPLQLFRVTSELYDAVEKRNVVAAVFYDFKKAFDTVWHKALLGKLKYFGISGPLLNWLKDFVTTRIQFVEVEDCLSSAGLPSAGVPQGSPLSPTLFLLYINSITSATDSPTNCFADDTCTITPPLTLDMAQTQIQSDVNCLSTWALDHKLTLHPSKTVCMLFHHTHTHSPHLNVFLHNIPITQVSHHKHLGVTLHCNLSWSTHTDSLVSKSSAMFAILRHLKSDYHFSNKSLLQVYSSLIRPMLEYGSIAYCGLSERNSRRLESLQQKALNICGFPPQHLVSLSSRRNSLVRKLFSSILDCSAPAHILCLFSWPFVESISQRTSTLRNSSAIRLPRPHTNLLLSSPLYRAASIYNSSL